MKSFNYIEKEERPWGVFYVIHDEQNYKIKRLEIKPGGRLSYQFHKKRSETWVIIQGKPLITLNGKLKKYQEGDHIKIGKQVKYRIKNSSKENIILIEVQTEHTLERMI